MSNILTHAQELRDTNLIKHAQKLLNTCEQGPVRDQQQGRLDRFIERLAALPKKVANQGPFKTREESAAVLKKEFAFVIAAIDGAN